MSAGMIIALGPQNAFLIKNGLQKNSKTLNIAAIFILIDIILISIGAIGVGSIISQSPFLRFFMTIFAAGFFIFYGYSSIIKSRANKSKSVEKKNAYPQYLTAIFLSVANPAVIFDTIVIVGGLASRYTLLEDRVIFTFGAIAASIMWFISLTAVSFWASRYVDNDKTWKYVERVIGVFMIIVGSLVLLDLYRAEMLNPTF